MMMRNVPHGRGDEPEISKDIVDFLYMFPTDVGMNRLSRPTTTMALHVPHGRGDEPISSSMSVGILICSPRTWG